MKINKFTKQKNGMYNITFENGTTLQAHEDIILKYELLIKKEVSEKEEKKILEENTTYEAYDLAIKYITKKMRSRKEIETYLKSKEIDEKNISNVTELLQKNGYLNDKLYAESFINDKIILSSDGPLKIKKQLIENGISSNIVEEKIQIFDKELEEEKINKIISKMQKSNKNKSAYVLKNKIIDYLSNLGYERANILGCLSNFSFENDNDLVKKEYEKVYKKLSKKYQGKELEYKVKQKMYSMGFTNFFTE